MNAAAPRARFVAPVCFLISMIEGFDLQAAGVAAPTLGPAFHLSASAMSLFFSSAIVGLVFGAMAGGRIADRFGRRTGLIFALGCFGIFSLLTSMSWDFSSLVIFRFLTGLGLGGAMPNLIAIAAETARPGRSAGAVSLMYAGMPTGGAIAAAVAMSGWHGDWVRIFLIGGTAPLIVMPLAYGLLPALVVRREAIVGTGRSWETLFSGGRLAASLLLWLAFFIMLLLLYLLLNWLPLLLVKSGVDKTGAGLVQVAFNLAGATASIVIGPIVDRHRARMPLITMLTVLVIALCVFARSPSGLVPIILSSAAVGAALMAVQATLYGLAPKLYTASVRGTGVGVTVAVGRFGSIVGPLIAGAFVSAGMAPTTLFALLIPVALVGGVAVMGMLWMAARNQLFSVAIDEPIT